MWKCGTPPALPPHTSELPALFSAPPFPPHTHRLFISLGIRLFPTAHLSSPPPNLQAPPLLHLLPPPSPNWACERHGPGDGLSPPPASPSASHTSFSSHGEKSESLRKLLPRKYSISESTLLVFKQIPGLITAYYKL